MIDFQCARCGGSTEFVDCWNCGGCGEFDEHENDPINCGPGEFFEDCDVCRGKGGWERCLNTEEWCQAHPLPGREGVGRGEIERFEVKEPEERTP